MTYKGISGKSYTIIEPAIGKGGEGSVYKIVGMPDYVLKVFLEKKRTETRHRKLLAMIATPLSPTAMKQITWPIDVVYSDSQFVGYVMPAIKDNEELNVMYSDKYICTLSEKIRLAKNLCAAINAIHNSGQVCGDLNPKNIKVDPKTGRITLVDTDSYHIRDLKGKRIYRCEAGLPEYLPREMQEKMKNGMNLITAPLPTFTKYTDLFALAVHIFALLMNGCHPFACAIDNKENIMKLSNSQPSVAAPQPIENICNGFFPFYTKKHGITIPRYAPKFDILPKNIQSLFVRAFVDGHSDPAKRPDTVEWYHALSDMQKNLLTCSNNNMHMYPNHLRKCPWCELDKELSVPIEQENITQPIKQNKIVNNITAAPAATPTAIGITTSPTATGMTRVPTAGGMMTSPITTGTTTSPTASSMMTSPTATNSTQLKHNSNKAPTAVFWLVTLAVTLGGQALVHSLWGAQIIEALFGDSYRSSVYYFSSNIGIAAGHWGFITCGLIGSIIYNTRLSKKEKLYGYKWYHYILSIIVSFASSAAWILLLILIQIVVLILVGILVIGFIIGIFSGS